jgi:hypothetical protein
MYTTIGGKSLFSIDFQGMPKLVAVAPYMCSTVFFFGTLLPYHYQIFVDMKAFFS